MEGSCSRDPRCPNLVDGLSLHGNSNEFVFLLIVLVSLHYFSVNLSSTNFRLARPSIVQGLGYLHTKTQIYTVPPYIPAAFLTVMVAFLSDRYRMRMGFALLLLIPSIIGTLPVSLALRS